MSNILRATAGKPVDLKGGPFGGMHPDLRPSDIPESGFVYLENVRRVGGVFTNRPGQTDFADIAGKPTGIVDFPGPGDGGSKGLYFTNWTNNVLQFSQEQDPKFQNRLPWDTDTNNILGDLGGLSTFQRLEWDASGDVPAVSMLVTNTGDTAGARVWAVSKVSPGYHLQPELNGTQQLTYLFRLPVISGVTYSLIHELIQYQDRLYIAAGDSGGSNFAIFSWDGRTLYLEPVAVATQPNGSALFRNTLIIGSGSNFLIKTDGTWAAPFATGAGAADAIAFVSYHDQLYFTDQFTSLNIYSFDGATVTTYVPATTGVTPLGGGSAAKVSSLAVWQDRLYYLWYHQTGGSNDEMWVGEYDETTSTWNAAWRDILTTFPLALSPGGMCAFNDRLYTAISNQAADPNDGIFVDVEALTLVTYYNGGDGNPRNLEIQ